MNVEKSHKSAHFFELINLKKLVKRGLRYYATI